MGIWSTEREQFTVFPILYITQTSPSPGSPPILYLYAKNEGTASIKIIGIEILTVNGSYINRSTYEILPKTSLELTIDNWIWSGHGTPVTLIRGERYTIKIYTEKHGVYFTETIAR